MPSSSSPCSRKVRVLLEGASRPVSTFAPETKPLPLKDRTRFLSTPAEVDGFLREHPSAAIFKAGLCHKNVQTFGYVQAELEPREDIPLGVIRVVAARAASNHVAELTRVIHESPQIFLFRDGKVVFDRDNWDITTEDLKAGARRALSGGQDRGLKGGRPPGRTAPVRPRAGRPGSRDPRRAGARTSRTPPSRAPACGPRPAGRARRPAGSAAARRQRGPRRGSGPT